MPRDENQMDINGTFVKDWRHYLTEPEKQELREQSVELRNTIDKMELNKKKQIKLLTAEITEVKTDEKLIREKLHDGYEDKSERVKMTEDFERGVVEYFHHETGELVHTEEMSERQKRSYKAGRMQAI